jgi:F-type H+-transporting ATPase subunit b
MFGWTLVTFVVMAYVLTKLAWRPILDALDVREQGIRDAVKLADQTKVEYANIDEKRAEIISAADARSKELLDKARQSGREAERVIKEKAKEDAGILMTNAEREIRTARDKAAADLREESVELALNLAGKILEEKLDPDTHRELTDRLIAKL